MTTTIKKTAYCLVIFLFIFAGCKKNDSEEIPVQVELDIDPTTEPSRLSKAFKIKNGSNLKGSAPVETTTTDLLITKYQASALVTADNYLFIPLIGKTTESVSGIYLEVVGADNYWAINSTLNSDNSQVLSVELPKNLREGNFEMSYRLKGASGGVGKPVKLKAKVISPIEYCSDGGAFGDLIEGKDGLVSYSFTFGEKAGYVTIEYNTFQVPDRIDVRYNNEWVASTGSLLSSSGPPTKQCRSVTAGDGFVGSKGSFQVYYDGKKSNKKLDIYVSGCLDGGTQWQFRITQCPEWYRDLPDCPCTYDASIDGRSQSGGTWKDFSNGCRGFFSYLNDYHYGARHEIRWAVNEDMPGQQCTYDLNGRLITGGIAAGSPDKFGVTGPCNSNSKHTKADVDTWEKIPCWQYMRDWPANKGSSCQSNIVNDIAHMKKMIGEMTCKEATNLIKKAKETQQPSIDLGLQNYILGRPGGLTDAQLISALQNWKKAIKNSDGIYAVIDKSIANLQ